MPKPETYPQTRVLVNHFDERDDAKLTIAEHGFTTLRGGELLKNPIKGEYDLNHLQEIHRRLFSDVYAWAGQVRDFDISKRSVDGKLLSRFAEHETINKLASEVKDQVASLHAAKSVGKSDAVQTLTDIQAKLNFIHPFAEGNGRSTQILMTGIAKAAGYALDYGQVAKDAWALANALSMPHFSLYEKGAVQIPREANTEMLRGVFEKIAVPLTAVNSLQESAFIRDGNRKDTYISGEVSSIEDGLLKVVSGRHGVVTIGAERLDKLPAVGERVLIAFGTDGAGVVREIKPRDIGREGPQRER